MTGYATIKVIVNKCFIVANYVDTNHDVICGNLSSQEMETAMDNATAIEAGEAMAAVA